ncbi:hypothetical protein KsCSTR_18230 [Candidatus Kuenenia stuttgartiensis]|uniref:Uncharacterized protein n=1 Tax=Kuenenia stuttgartiensis TaxID=174633 RepID=A0A6G7GP94_KUEST|nr:hypothetical protein [Candidatus Kuenenia stuttgartiensis]QII11202.1 hypothetical protein KsCSTR_18230 [Candidatus Kuenenia stuttgartiensis]
MKENDEIKIDATSPYALLGAVLASAFFSAKIAAILEKRNTTDEEIQRELLDRWFTYTATAESLSEEA